MKFQEGMAICVVVLLTSCAGARHSVQIECTREAALARGQADGAAGHKSHLSFTHSCTPETRELAVAAYKEGFQSARPKRKAALSAAREEADTAEVAELEDENSDTQLALEPLPSPAAARSPSALSWVCEVEASSKIFTGVGGTQTEALGSARANCGSHFQSSYCTKSDCRQAM